MAGFWIKSDITGDLSKGEDADIRKEEGLKGRDQLADFFADSRTDMIPSCGKREARTDARGRAGTDSPGTGKWLSGERGEREQRQRHQR